ncbi:LPXTG cell wall anchor domain-containing protein, partial [Streptomyces sp. MS06]|uniref:LPXTG cell wall anchor domain-containing protein n=1 Tax=Streptomyces sp. MS06 TaxID=3385974 RepID=UPI00399FB226
TCGTGANANAGSDSGAGAGAGAGAGEQPKASPSASLDAAYGGGAATPGTAPTESMHTAAPAAPPAGGKPTEAADHGSDTGRGSPSPKTDRKAASAEPTRSEADTTQQGGSEEEPADEATTAAPEETPGTGGKQEANAVQPQTVPQAASGDLAETGTTLWPAAAGGVLLLAGLAMLIRTRRRTT